MDTQTSINQKGAYLYSEADCPHCGETTSLRHLEGPNSPVKVEKCCPHAKSHFLDVAGVVYIEFQEATGVNHE